MAQIVTITLTTAGADTENFSLYSDVDSYVTAFETGVTKASLLVGYVSSLVPDGATIIRVMSNADCVNYIDLAITGPTTTTAAPTTTTLAPTTTTISPTTTTTTCLPYGTYLGTWFCVGYDRYRNYADGECGSYSELYTVNSALCGYVAPTTTTLSPTTTLAPTTTTLAPTTTTTLAPTTTTTLAPTTTTIGPPDVFSAFWWESDNVVFTSSTPDSYIKCLWEALGQGSSSNYRYYSSEGINIGTQLYEYADPYNPISNSTKFAVGNRLAPLATFSIITTVNGIITDIVSSDTVTAECPTTTTAAPTTTASPTTTVSPPTTTVAPTTTTTTAGDTTPPSQVTGLVISTPVNYTFRLDWDAATDNVGVTGHTIDESTDGATWMPKSIEGNVLTVTYGGYSGGEFRYFRVRALDAAGNLGQYSQSASGTATGAA